MNKTNKFSSEWRKKFSYNENEQYQSLSIGRLFLACLKKLDEQKS